MSERSNFWIFDRPLLPLTSRHQRNKLKLDDVPKLPEWQRLRLQHTSNDMSVPNLVIRRPSVVQGVPIDYLGIRKNSGGEAVVRATLVLASFFLKLNPSGA